MPLGNRFFQNPGVIWGIDYKTFNFLSLNGEKITLKFSTVKFSGKILFF